MNGTPTQQAVTVGGQVWSAPWPADSTKNATLSALRAAYPKTTPFGQSIYPDMAFAMVRGQAGFSPSPVFGVDADMDNLAYTRFWWPTF